MPKKIIAWILIGASSVLASPAQPGGRSVVDTILKLRDYLRDEYVRIQELSGERTPSAELRKRVQVFHDRYRQFSEFLPKATLREPSAVDLISGIRTEVESYHRKVNALHLAGGGRKQALLPEEEADYLKLKKKLETLIQEPPATRAEPLLPPARREPPRENPDLVALRRQLRDFPQDPIRKEAPVLAAPPTSAHREPPRPFVPSVTSPPPPASTPPPEKAALLTRKIEKLEENITVLMKKLESSSQERSEAPSGPRKGSVTQENERVLARLFPGGLPLPGKGETIVTPLRPAKAREPEVERNERQQPTEPEETEVTAMLGDEERDSAPPQASPPAPPQTPPPGKSALRDRAPDPRPAMPSRQADPLRQPSNLPQANAPQPGAAQQQASSPQPATAPPSKQDEQLSLRMEKLMTRLRQARDGDRPGPESAFAPPDRGMASRDRELVNRLEGMTSQLVAAPPAPARPPGPSGPASPAGTRDPSRPGSPLRPDPRSKPAPLAPSGGAIGNTAAPGRALAPPPPAPSTMAKKDLDDRLRSIRQSLAAPTPVPTPAAESPYAVVSPPENPPVKDEEFQHRLAALQGALQTSKQDASYDRAPTQSPPRQSAPPPRTAAAPPAPVATPRPGPANLENRIMRLRTQLARTGPETMPLPGSRLEADRDRNQAGPGPRPGRVMTPFQTASAGAIPPAPRRPAPVQAFSESDFLDPSAAPAARPPAARVPRDEGPAAVDLRMLDQLETVYASKPSARDAAPRQAVPHPAPRDSETPFQDPVLTYSPERGATNPPQRVLGPLHTQPQLAQVGSDTSTPFIVPDTGATVTTVEETVSVARKPTAVIVTKQRPFDVVHDEPVPIQVLEQPDPDNPNIWQFDDEPVYNIISDLAEAAKMNIIIHGTIPDSMVMDLHIEDRHPLKVLFEVLDLQKLEYDINREKDLVTVYSPTIAAPEVTRTYRFRSDYPVDIKQVMTVIQQTVLNAPAPTPVIPPSPSPGVAPQGEAGEPGTEGLDPNAGFDDTGGDTGSFPEADPSTTDPTPVVPDGTQPAPTQGQPPAPADPNAGAVAPTAPQTLPQTP